MSDIRNFFQGGGDKETPSKDSDYKRKLSPKKYDQTKRKRLVREDWLKEFPWAKFENGEVLHCEICRKFPEISDKDSTLVKGIKEKYRKETLKFHDRTSGTWNRRSGNSWAPVLQDDYAAIDTETMSTTQTLTLTETEEDCSEDVEEAEQPVREAELFTFENCSKGIGIKICGGCSLDGEELYGIFVKRVLPGGLADQDGGIRKGDQILEVNGESLEGVTNERAVSILRQASASNHVEMAIVRDEQARLEFQEVLDKNSGRSVPCTPVPTDARQSLTVEALKQHAVATENHPLTTLTLKHPQDSSPVYQRQEFENFLPEESVISPAARTPQDPVLNGDIKPRQHWRGLIPSHASTPLGKGSTTSMRTGSSGSQFSSLPYAEPSPVGAPVTSLSGAMSTYNGSSVFAPHNGGLLPNSRNMSQSRKLSLDPHVQLKVGKLNAALSYIGLDPTPEQEEEICARLNVATTGTVTYGDFVEVVREVFRLELEDRSAGHGTSVFAAGDFTDLVEPPAFHADVNGAASGAVGQHQLLQENEDLRQDNIRLQVLLREKEDELLGIRMEAQGAIHEQRTLRSKVHLAAEAQKAARDMEHDYEEVVQLLETEIAQLKLHLGKQGESDPIMQRRLAVLTCQLRKAEQEKETLRVATDKLLQFAETVYETFTDTSSGTARPLTNSGDAPKLGKHKRSKQSNKQVATDAKETVRTVRTLIDTQSLPFGWEETYTTDGMKYYINHLNQVTAWSHPLSNVTHLPIIEDEKKLKGDSRKSSESAG